MCCKALSKVQFEKKINEFSLYVQIYFSINAAF